jgi:CubicO group peptidase (beta-lactamase class C family)
MVARSITRRRGRRWIAMSIGAISLVGAVVVAPSAWAAGPTSEDWPTAAPETAGIDSAKLAELLTLVQEQEVPLHSLLAMRDGTVVLDAYHYPYDGSIYHDVASVTKSILTTLVGIAADQGLLDLEAPVLSFFPDRAPAEGDEAWARVTVGHLASMTGGFECIDDQKITQAAMRASPDYVAFVLDQPMVAEPGTTFGYCDPGMHLLSAVLTEATGQTALEFARTELFEPLGISEVYWPSDPQGYTHGWGDLALKPADMARIGQVFLDGGRWGDEQVVPAAWVAEATRMQVDTGREEDYGYGWWISGPDEPIATFAAEGDGEQRIVVVPAVSVIVVATGGGYDWDAVLDPVGAAVIDGWRPLPPDPAGEAALQEEIADLAAPPPAVDPGPLPEVASAVSGVTWAFPENPYVRSIRLDFDDSTEAIATLDVPSERDLRVDRVGLDGVVRPSVAGRPIVASGRWTDDQTFELDIDEGPGFHQYQLRLSFEGDRVEMDALGQTMVGTPLPTG